MAVSRRQFLGASLAAFALGASTLRAEVARRLSAARVIEMGHLPGITEPPVITSLAVSPTAELFATAGDDHLVRLWAMADGQLKQELRGHADWIRGVLFSADGKFAISAGDDRTIKYWSVTDGKVQRTLLTSGAVQALAATADGQKLVSVGFEDKLRIYDLPTGAPQSELDCPCRDIRTIALSPDSQLMAAAGRNGKIRIWNLQTGQDIHTFPAHKQRIRAMAFSPDGAILATGSEDRSVRFWNPATGEAAGELPMRPAKILSLAYCGPALLAVGGSDNRIRVWDMTTEPQETELAGHTGSVSALAWVNSTRMLLSASFDTTVRFWDLGTSMGDKLAREGRKPTPAAIKR